MTGDGSNSGSCFLFSIVEFSVQIQCLSTMYDVDLHVGVGAGYGMGVCMLSDPTFVYQEIKFGAGFSVGASAFSVCDGAQIAEGYDDGRENSKSKGSN